MKIYCTRSLYEASFLITKGFKAFSKSRFEGWKTSFLFEETPQLSKAVLDFYNNRATVKAKSFSDTYKRLKKKEHFILLQKDTY